MNEDFMEYMVKKKKEGKDTALRVISIVMSVLSVLSLVLIPNLISLIVTAAVIAFTVLYVFPSTDIEYEYLYCDKLLTVDKIMAQKSRKTIAEYQLERMEIVAPVSSVKLDEYNNRQVTVYEYWSKEENPDPIFEHKPYAIYYEGNTKIILDLPEKFVKIMWNDAPRKVFTE